MFKAIKNRGTGRQNIAMVAHSAAQEQERQWSQSWRCGQLSERSQIEMEKWNQTLSFLCSPETRARVAELQQLRNTSEMMDTNLILPLALAYKWFILWALLTSWFVSKFGSNGGEESPCIEMGPASIWSHNNTNDTCTRGIRNVTCGIIYIFPQFLETFSCDFGSPQKVYCCHCQLRYSKQFLVCVFLVTRRYWEMVPVRNK